MAKQGGTRGSRPETKLRNNPADKEEVAGKHNTSELANLVLNMRKCWGIYTIVHSRQLDSGVIY